jgi:FKBP-type peptidyl-prolyl cis-trans isomerase
VAKTKTLQEKLDEPVGLTYDMLYEIRRAMRILRRAEKRIVTAHRAEKRMRAQSKEWEESKRIRDDEADKLDSQRWYASDVTRTDAGLLYNAVRWIDGKRVEAEHTPTHSRAQAEKLAKQLNKEPHG